MKKFTKILIIALSVMILAGVFVFASFADDTITYPEATADAVIQVIKSDGTVRTSSDTVKFDAEKNCFYRLDDAFSAAQTGDTIKLLADYEFGKLGYQASGAAEGRYPYSIASYSNKEFTLDLNGHTLSASYNRYINSSNAAGTCYQFITIGNGATLNLVGNGGKIRSSAAIIILTGGDAVLNFAENDTISFEGIDGYQTTDKNGESVAESTFAGAPMIKIGSNQGANYKEDSEGKIHFPTVNVPTTVVNSDFSLFGAHAGAALNMNGATLNTTFTGTDYAALSFVGFNANHSYFKALGECYTLDASGNKVNQGTWVYYPPKINISDSVINNKDKGKILLVNSFYGTANLDHAATTEDAPWNVTVSGVTYYTTKAGGGFDHAPIFNATGTEFNNIGTGDTFSLSSAMLNATFDSCDINSASTYVFYFGNNAAVKPLAVVRATNTNITTTSSATQQVFYRSGTVILDGGYYDVGTADNLFNGGYGWKSESSIGPTETGVPSHVSAVGGYGSLIKSGTIISRLFTPVNFGSQTGTNRAFSIESGTAFYKTIDPVADYNYVFKLSDTPIPEMASTKVYDFEGATVGTEIYNVTDKSNKSIDGASIICQDGGTPRTGKYTVKASPAESNKYVNNSWYKNDNCNGTAPFINITGFQSATPPSSSTDTLPATMGESIDEYAYYAVDLDMMTLTGTYAAGSLQFCFFAYDYSVTTTETDGTTTTKYTRAATGDLAKVPIASTGTTSATVSFTDSGNFGNKAAGMTSLSTTPGVWNHVTYVMELPKNEDGTINVNNVSSSNLYVYVNGELAGKSVATTLSKMNLTSGYYFNDNPKYGGMSELRINMNKATTTDDTMSTCYDNIMVTRYGVGYTGTADDIGNLIYSAYGTPKNIPAASIEDSEGNVSYYDTFKDAFSAVKTGENLTLHRNFDLESYIPAVAHTITLNGYIMSADKIYSRDYVIKTETDENDSVIAIEIAEPTEDELVSVTWKYSDGTERVDKIIKGLTLDVRAAEIGESNGWYRSIYKWVDSEGADLTADTLVVTEPLVFESKFVEYSAYVKCAVMDMVLVSHYHVRFGIPKTLPEGISDVKVYNNTNREASGALRSVHQNINYPDGTYSMYSIGYPGVANVTSNSTVVIDFNALIDGETVAMTQTFYLNPINYFTAIYQSGEHSDAHALIADLAQYTVELYKVMNTTCPTAIMDLYNNTAEKRTKLSELSVPKSTADYSSLSKYVDNIYFAAGTYEPAYKLEFKQLKDEEGNFTEGVTKAGFVVKDIVSGNSKSYGTRSGSGFTGNFVGTSYYSYATATSIPTAYLIETCTITLTVTDAQGKTSTVSGTYDLAAYCEGVVKNDPANGNFAKAIYAFSSSAQAYRYYVAE